MMTSDELEEQLIVKCLHEVDTSDNIMREKMNCENDPKEFALLIARGFRSWLKTKQEETCDEVFLMGVNLVLLVDYYHEFRMALNTGNAVMIEFLLLDYLPIFYLERKSTTLTLFYL